MINSTWFERIGKHLLLSVLFGIITTVFFYTGFGVDDHIEQVPIILRSMDKSFIVNDFFTNMSTSSIAREYYSQFIAFFAGNVLNLPLVFLILTFFINISISIITYLFSRDLFHNSSTAGIYASALVMTSSTFTLGWSTNIFSSTLIPSFLVIPLIMAAVWLMIKKKIIVSITLCGIASIIHPLLGLEMGGILLFVFIINAFLQKHGNLPSFLKRVIFSAIILFCFTCISILPQFSQQKINATLFIYILAIFRHPHHYIPSSFGLDQYLVALAFLCISVIIFLRDKKERKKNYDMLISMTAGVIVILCFLGYFFVEVIPTRFWVTAQTYRLLFFLKWFGLIMIAGSFNYSSPGKSSENPARAVNTHLHGFTAKRFFQSFMTWIDNKFPYIKNKLHPALLFLIVVLFNYLSSSFISILLFTIYILSIIFINNSPRKLLNLAIAATMIIVALVGVFHRHLPFITQAEPVQIARNNLALKIKSELGSTGDEIAEYARLYTPRDSIILTPPTWGQFRIDAQRAIVVDFKAFPFEDTAMEEWYDRLITCYGKPKTMGLEMVKDLENNYENISDDKLLKLKNEYGISYVVLYSVTPTKLKVIFENSNFKIVDMTFQQK